MKTPNFEGNYIKRISFYAGLIAFFVALGFSIFSYFGDTLKEGESLIENAKSSLAPYIKWYQEDSSKELERYRNLSKAEFEKLDVDLIIEKNLQDIKVIVENVDVLTRFISSYDENNKKELREINIQGMKSANYKFHIPSILLEKERRYNPTNTYFILNNPKRYQIFSIFQNFLESKIKEILSNEMNQDIISIDRLTIYAIPMINFFDLPNSLMIFDIYNNTCKINKSIIQNSLSQYRFIQESTKVLFETLDEKINHFSVNDEKKEVLLGYKKFYQDFITSINKGQSTIQAIQSNLKKCK